MHSYTTNNENIKIYSWIAFLSVAASLALAALFKWLKIEVPWFVDAPAVVGFYGIFFKIYDIRIWKWRYFNNTPNLTGNWEGKISSSHDRYNNEHPAKLTIKQTWSHISIVLTTENSRSESCVAMISTKTPEGAKIQYAYENKPRNNAVSTMKRHDGTATLIFKRIDGKQILEGDYYTGRDRKNLGTLYFEKIVE